MNATQTQVAMAAKLYEARDAMRRILGDKFAARMAELGAVIKQVATKRGHNELRAAQDIIRAGELQGMDALQVLAAAVELVEPSALTYWHGGRPGLKPGSYLLPPSITKAPCCSDYGAAAVHRRDRVYVTTQQAAALVFAAGHPDGVIYECEPVGAIVPDPDCSDPGLSFECEKARIVRCFKPSREAMQAARSALFGSSE